jgi:opacity protein-like surface antigen
MKLKRKLVPKPATALLLVGLGSLLPALAQNPFEYFQRAGKTEVYGIGQYLHSDDVKFNVPVGPSFPGGTSTFKADDTGLGGFGFAFHINDFLAVHADFMFGSQTFSGSVPSSLIFPGDNSGPPIHTSNDVFLQTGRFNIDYNIINRRVTPFLTAGLGYQYMETELHNVAPTGGYYWDPWYGWVYYSDHPYAWDTYFTLNAGAGVRWNITDHFFIKATAGATWVDYGGAQGFATQIEGIFGIGMTF